MKIKELKDLTDNELRTQRRDFKQELFHMRMQQQSGQLEKSSQIRSIRRDVARIETLLSQRRLNGTAKAPANS